MNAAVPAGMNALIYLMFEGISRLLHDRSQESPQRHRGTEQNDQVISTRFVSVALW